MAEIVIAYTGAEAVKLAERLHLICPTNIDNTRFVNVLQFFDFFERPRIERMISAQKASYAQ